ncbi:GNAT family N-acetyltransferase [Dysgonomonas sp. ZJ279]|uniref:GNAT family N-acetyltransferase n=1 Tax=Dysgonomonas sp. ZJ279 TaxID=2709796 RepID=UPI0013E9DD7A|nr:N-acetyltransferase [Dysgonomonas sp. ZJ279]
MNKNYRIRQEITQNQLKIEIRETNINDFESIMKVERLGFGYNKEAKLVADLLSDETAEPIISLLAFHNGEAIGHILFTKVTFDNKENSPLMHILAPLAVIPTYQRQGIGGMLIKAGIEILQEKGSKLIFVLGHKEYYPKYGFTPHAKKLGFPAPYPIPDEYGEYWMVQAISEDGLNVGKGKIKCGNTLDRPEHWRDDESDKI